MSKLHRVAGQQASGGHAAADVVFVHGLGGDPFATWRHGEAGAASWPGWLAQECPQVAVWSLGYAASPSRWSSAGRFFGRGDGNSGQAMSLPDRAAQVLDAMVLEGLGQRPLVFVCHSLGGLLVKQLLRKSVDAPAAAKRQVAEQVRGVMFLATPHSGAKLASLADALRTLLGATVSLQDLRAHDAHLRDLFDWYRHHAQRLRLRTVTYYEGRSFKGVACIVNPGSAHPGVGDDPVMLDEDHVSIAKPRSRDAQVCKALRQLLHGHALAARADAPPLAAAAPEQPDPGSSVAAAATPIVVRVETATPPDGARHRPPRELPPRAAQFFGRDDQRAALAGRLRRGLNTAVVGAGGLGKTALAAEALTDLVGSRGERLHDSPFPDGLVFLDLYAKGGLAESVWNELASRVAGAGFMAQSPAHSRAREACRGRHLLLVIEGGEEADGQDGRPPMHTLLEVLSPENRWLLLTRVSTQSNPVDTITLRDALDPADAARLLDALTAGTTLPGNSRAEVLALLEGHPLALTWAGNLLARGDEAPAALVRSWQQSGLPPLSDPTRAQHTLRWLYERSRRSLGPVAQDCLALAGLIAHAPFPAALVLSGLHAEAPDAPDLNARDALRQLVQHGLLRWLDEQDLQFAHVLPYRFAREGPHTLADAPARLAAWLRTQMDAVLRRDTLAPDTEQSMARLVRHAAALLRCASPPLLWLELADPLLYDMAGVLRDKGRIDLRAEALAALTDWFERLPAATREEPFWSRENSMVLDALGTLRCDLGDLGDALVAYRAALAIRQRLAGADALDTGRQRDLGASHNHVGNVLLEQGDPGGALAAFRDGLAICQGLTSADASNPQWQRDLSIMHDKAGSALREQGDLDGALAAHRDALAIRQRLASADALNVLWQRDLSASHDKVGHVLHEQNDLEGALGAHRAALAINQRLASADGSNAGLLREQGLFHSNVGQVLYKQGKLDAALADYRAALAISQRLAGTDGSNAIWQGDLSYTLTLMAELCEAQGDAASALDFALRSLAIDEKLARLDPTNAAWQKNVALSRALVAGLQAD